MKTHTQRLFAIGYSILTIIQLCTSNIDALSLFNYIAKPAIVLSLLWFFNSQNKHLPKSIVTFTNLALVCSVLGDILLMFVSESPNFFIAGLAAFLIAHIMYVIVFKQQRNTEVSPWLFVVFLIAYALGLFYIIYGNLKAMLIPVSAYVVVILTMATMAYLRKQKVPHLSYTLVLVGAILFMLSDSLIALNKFYKPVLYPQISIMLTYALAQYLIINGILKSTTNTEAIDN